MPTSHSISVSGAPRYVISAGGQAGWGLAAMCAQHVLNGSQGAVVHRGPGSNRGNSLGWGRGGPLNNQQQAASLALDVFMRREPWGGVGRECSLDTKLHFAWKTKRRFEVLVKGKGKRWEKQ